MAADEDWFARCLAFEMALQDRSCTTSIPFPYGTGLLHDRLPLVWDLNFLRVEDPVPGIEVSQLIETTDALLEAAGAQHRRVVVQDRPAGEAMSDAFQGAGWRPNRFVWMARAAAGLTPPAGVVLEEVPPEQLEEAREPFIRQESYGEDEEAVRQLLERLHVTRRAIQMHTFAARSNSEVASTCELYVEGDIAQVEDVATLEHQRRRGLAQAVVAYAVAAARRAGAEVVFLVADDEDWPKELYRKLGFEPIGYTYQFLRLPED